MVKRRTKPCTDFYWRLFICLFICFASIDSVCSLVHCGRDLLSALCWNKIGSMLIVSAEIRSHKDISYRSVTELLQSIWN
jgi:hypothetical protein